MKILLDSGVVKYINILFVISLFFAFFSVLVGFVCFVFFLITFSSIYLVSYLFRMEERLLSKSTIISPTDGKVMEVRTLDALPDIITKHINYKTPYHMIMVQSTINNIYFKYAPVDCIVEEIQVFNPKTINKNSNFKHKNYRTYIVFKLILIQDMEVVVNNKTPNIEPQPIFMINEVLFGDRNYDMYKLYVKAGDRVKKGDLLVCNHFYSLLWIYLPSEYDLSIQRGQSLFYQETSLVLGNKTII